MNTSVRPSEASTVAFSPSGWMQSSTRDLELRLAAASAEDTARGMFFNGALSAVRQVAGEAAARSCAQAAGNPKFIDFFTYPIQAFLRMAWLAVDILQPQLGGPDAAFRRLGRQAVDDYLSSTSGKILLTIVGENPRRLLANVPGAYKAAVGYGERSVTWLGERHCRIDFRRDFMPHPYHEGVLTAAVEALGGKNVLAQGRTTGLLDSTYEIKWD